MTATHPAGPGQAPRHDTAGPLTYQHKPRIIGSAIVFRLEEKAIAWSDGRTSSSLPLHQIESVRLLFRPANLYTHRYRIEVRQRLGRRIWFSNLSYRGLADIEANDEGYTAFVRALCAAVAQASPKARFIVGEPAWRYGLVALVTAGLAASIAILTLQTAKLANWPILAVVLTIGGYMIWQMSLWLTKNRPGTFDPLALPPALLPTLTPPRA